MGINGVIKIHFLMFTLIPLFVGFLLVIQGFLKFLYK